MSDQSNSQARAILQTAGLRQTGPRLEILGCLIDRAGPASVEEIKPEVAAHLVTVYRVLNELSAAGVIYQTDFRTGRSYFEYQNRHHHHLVCSSCGLREEVNICLPADWRRQVTGPSRQFDQIDGHLLEFFGRCLKCRRSK